MVNIRKIIEENSIKIYFQVILSPMETHSISVESFVRGIDPETNNIISPYELFTAAQKANLTDELDALCIQLSLKKFKVIEEANPNAMLYMNINSDYFKAAIETDSISIFAEKYGISNHHVVLDLANTSITNKKTDFIQEFITYHRSKGFYISLDDIGKNYSNIDRIMLFNPDIIKINHQMFNKLKDDNYRRLMIDNLIKIAHKMGILVISTGVETESDIIDAMASGAQMIQGYYVSDTAEYSYDEIFTIINQFNRDCVFNIIDAQYQGSEREAIASVVRYISKLRKQIQACSFGELQSFADQLLHNTSFIESGYMLDMKGVQISDVNINKGNFENRNIELFGLYEKGSSHILEESYIRLQHELLTDWVTRPFRSKLTNEVCVTASFKITLKDADTLIVVINIDFVDFSHSISSNP